MPTSPSEKAKKSLEEFKEWKLEELVAAACIMLNAMNKNLERIADELSALKSVE